MTRYCELFRKFSHSLISVEDLEKIAWRDLYLHCDRIDGSSFKTMSAFLVEASM